MGEKLLVIVSLSETVKNMELTMPIAILIVVFLKNKDIIPMINPNEATGIIADK